MITLIWTKKAGLLGSIHQTNRHSVGAVLFPVSLLLCALLYWPINPLIYQGAALILALSDGMAGIIGQRFGRRSYCITGHKTIEGSFVFLGTTFLILSGLHLYHRSPLGLSALIGITVAALFLTLVEGGLGKGWDNLPISLLGGLATYLLI